MQRPPKWGGSDTWEKLPNNPVFFLDGLPNDGQSNNPDTSTLAIHDTYIGGIWQICNDSNVSYVGPQLHKWPWSLWSPTYVNCNVWWTHSFLINVIFCKRKLDSLPGVLPRFLFLQTVKTSPRPTHFDSIKLFESHHQFEKGLIMFLVAS